MFIFYFALQLDTFQMHVDLVNKDLYSNFISDNY